MGGDFLAFILGFWLSLSIRNLATPSWEQIDRHLVLFFFLFLIWLTINVINGLYDLSNLKTKKSQRHFGEAALMSLIVGIIFFYLLPNSVIAPKTILLLNVALGYGLVALWRWLYNKYLNTERLSTNVILVGFTPETEELIQILQDRPESGYKICALIDPDKKIKPAEFPFFDVYHGLNTIRPAITNHHAHLVIIAPHMHKDGAALQELYNLLFWKVQVHDLPSFYEVVTGRIPPTTFSESWFLEHLKNVQQPVYEKLRVLLDYLAGLTVGILFLAFLPFVALAIKLNSKGPIFIKQKRVGQFGENFTLYKFRSMYALSKDGSAEVEGAQFASKNDKRVTLIGKFIRKTRLDELPQSLNLLKRDITLIGPRPERPAIVDQLTEKMPYYPIRHIVKPGLTGWAVIHQNYTDTLETSLQKLQYDLFYIKNKSLLLDIMTLLRTVNVVIRMMGQ